MSGSLSLRARILGVVPAVAVAAWLMGCAPVEPVCEPSSITPDDTPCPEVYLGQGDIYEPGPLTVRRIEVAACELAAPRPMLVFAPEQEGSYAVVLFQHGFLSGNFQYSRMLEHVASHGFIVVAPQMYPPGLRALFGEPAAAQEAETAERIIAWLPGHLDALTGVRACTERLGLAGHSRGGKVAWIVVKRQPEVADAIAGVDPVDGSGGPLGRQDRVITGPFAFSVPALVIGTGLGGSCAPEGDNHVQFYEASMSPAWHVVVPGQGHADMLDDDASGVGLARLLCPGGPETEGMRRLTAGLMVALFRAALQGDEAAFSYLTDAEAAPIAVTIESK